METYVICIIVVVILFIIAVVIAIIASQKPEDKKVVATQPVTPTPTSTPTSTPTPTPWETVRSSPMQVTPPQVSCEDAKRQYLSDYTDVKNVGIDPWTHYLNNGASEGRKWNGASCPTPTPPPPPPPTTPYSTLGNVVHYRGDGSIAGNTLETMSGSEYDCKNKCTSIGGCTHFDRIGNTCILYKGGIWVGNSPGSSIFCKGPGPCGNGYTYTP